MSGTPIFEQLCRDYVEVGKAQPEDVTQPPTGRGLDGPSRSTAGDVPVCELDDHLPLADVICPAE